MFQKKPAQPIARGTLEAVSQGATFSVLAADLVVKGNVTAQADLHIDGRIEGDITCASLVQGESSEVHGEIRADAARLAGVVRGAITVGDLVVVRTARIHGDVHYDTITIEHGAVVDGRLGQRAAHAAPVQIEG